MSGTEEVKELIDGAMEDADKSMPSTHPEEEAVKKKYGGIIPKKPPLISKVNLQHICQKNLDSSFLKCNMRCQDHERAYFDSADWALGKQGVEKPEGPLEALRPKLQPTQQQTRYCKSPCAPSEVFLRIDGNTAPPEDGTTSS
ncbi:uncharacterized protein [Primulina eburnea]